MKIIGKKYKINIAIVGLVISVLLLGCTQSKKEEYLTKIFNGEFDELGTETGYINSSGDTVIALGKYYYCYTDTFRNYAIVLEKGGRCIAIDKHEKELFEIFWYDNGPDYISEGLFRIKKNEKIGYANKDGEIMIKPRFDCAFPFQNGKAKVSVDCETVFEGEYRRWESKNWFYIDKQGKKIE